MRVTPDELRSSIDEIITIGKKESTLIIEFSLEFNPDRMQEWIRKELPFFEFNANSRSIIPRMSRHFHIKSNRHVPLKIPENEFQGLLTGLLYGVPLREINMRGCDLNDEKAVSLAES